VHELTGEILVLLGEVYLSQQAFHHGIGIASHGINLV
jgi:hypothetical protein